MTARLPTVLAIVALAGCGGSSRPEAAGTPTPAATATPAPGPDILAAQAKATTFTDVSRRVAALYRSHGHALTRYAVQDVRYTPATRDKVLRTCRTAGPLDGVAGLTSTKAVGCAPLIFFYYHYGADSHVPASVVLAQRLYWYALTHERGPAGAKASLTALLRSWGLH